MESSGYVTVVSASEVQATEKWDRICQSLANQYRERVYYIPTGQLMDYGVAYAPYAVQESMANDWEKVEGHYEFFRDPVGKTS